MPYTFNNVNVLVMCLADPSGNPRPFRTIKLCRKMGFNVSVFGYPPQNELDIDSYYPLSIPQTKIFHKITRRIYGLIASFIPCPLVQTFVENRRFGIYNAKKMFKEKMFDLIIVEDLFLLPLAFDIKKRAKILFDAREYYPRQNEGNLWFNLIEKPRRVQLCEKFLSKCDSIITVSNGLKREYEKEFDIKSNVIRSTPQYVDLAPYPAKKGRIRMVYHGVANRNRKIENLIEVFKKLDDRYEMDLILVGNSRYQEELKEIAKRIPKVRFLKPVPFKQIIPTIASYDIGFFYCEPTTFNLAHCLPNKFFEYIQARLMIAIGPSPDMADLVHKYNCGVVAKFFSIEAMADALNALDVEDINEAKKNSAAAAKDLCFEQEQHRLINVINNLIK